MAVVTPVTGGGFTVTDQTGTTYRFTQASGANWLISKITDATGMGETFGYSSGTLTTITKLINSPPGQLAAGGVLACLRHGLKGSQRSARGLYLPRRGPRLQL